MNLLHRLLRLLFPPKCVLCGHVLSDEETDLCHCCRTDTPDFPESRRKLTHIASWTALWHYEGTVRTSLLRYKFGNRRSYAEIYGRLLAMRLLRHGIRFDHLTWVPTARLRKWRRGYDQVELIAKATARELGVTPIPLLKKLRNNPPQSGISGAAQRRANVLGVYKVLTPEKIQGKRILLLDDIITTGATVSECARVLLTAGAGEVLCAAVAASHEHKNQ